MTTRFVPILLVSALIACTTERSAPPLPQAAPPVVAIVPAAPPPPPVAPDTERDAYAALAAGCGGERLTDVSLGTLRLGMSLDSVHAHCTLVREKLDDPEGMIEGRVVLSVRGRDVEVEISNGRVYRIIVTDSLFRTADSLGVGSPVATVAARTGASAFVQQGELRLGIPAQCAMYFVMPAPLSVLAATVPVESLKTLPPTEVIRRVEVHTHYPGRGCM